MKYLIIAFLFGLSTSCSQQNDLNQWENVKKEFIINYDSLNIPNLQLSYQQNIQNSKSLDSIAVQKTFFTNIQHKLSQMNVNNFSKKEQLNFDLITYEVELNLERLTLEEKWQKNKEKLTQGDGLSTLTNGKSWYVYFLKKWVDQSATPDEMFAFGLEEIARVKGNMKAIQEKSGMDSLTFEKHLQSYEFFYNDVDSIQLAFENLKIEMRQNAAQYFPKVKELPEVIIKKGTDKRMAIAPAFYMGSIGTFFYNYFDQPYNKRQIAWIYLHEAVPGHHYQNSLEKVTDRSDIQKAFEYFGYMEGYAAYVEELGITLGAYKTMYDEYGKWEWDLIRSVRVSMDVGLNYYNWSDEEALTFWQKYIQGQDAIAYREIARMKRWPAQVITYKYGGGKILSWKKKAEQNEGFDLMKFHEDILQFGNVPFSILEKYIQQ